MADHQHDFCPDCEEGELELNGLDRRSFIRAAGTGFAAVAGSSAVVLPRQTLAEKPKPKAKPAEALIRELHATLSDEQKKELVLPWDHGASKNNRRRSRPSRLRTYNRALLGKRIADHYTKPQQELVKKILRSILSSDEAYERITRYGKWDNSRSFDGNGAVIFGDPTGKKFAWVFAGHHLTVRCDGNSEPNAAFGGPMYYGPIANGYSARNVYYYQTKRVQTVFDALDAKQQKQAIAARNPGDRERGIQFPPKDAPKPGIAFAELHKDQQKLVETVMRELLGPFRKEDGDEVMQIIKANGGMEKIHLAFYEDRRMKDKQRWHFWRLEGPGFIWNYRVLPHVHCYVNIVERA